jgi:hypothetical protein
MKNKKWLTYTLGALLTLVVLAVVGVAGFRIGMMQNVSLVRPTFAHNFDRAPQLMQGNPQSKGEGQFTEGNFPDNGERQGMEGGFQSFGNRGNDRAFDRRDGGMRFPPFFGLIHLAVLALLLWLGYKLVKKSGWRLTRVQATSATAPAENPTPSAEIKEKKESE